MSRVSSWSEACAFRDRPRIWAAGFPTRSRLQEKEWNVTWKLPFLVFGLRADWEQHVVATSAAFMLAGHVSF